MAVATKAYAVRKFTVEEYYQLAEAGILSEDDLVELIEGEIMVKSPISSRHTACVDRLMQLFSRKAGDRAIVRVRNSMRLSCHSEPEPDIALLKPRDDFYSVDHPGPEDVPLIIEVAETSLQYDKEVKLPLYARYRIPEVWLINLEKGRIEEVHSRPEGERYKGVKTLKKGDRLALKGLPEFEFFRRGDAGILVSLLRMDPEEAEKGGTYGDSRILSRAFRGDLARPPIPRYGLPKGGPE